MCKSIHPIFLIFLMLGVSACARSMHSSTDCHTSKEGRVSCVTTVESMRGGGDSQYIEFSLPDSVSAVKVDMVVSVEKGAVNAWLGDPPTPVTVTAERNKPATLTDVAHAEKSSGEINGHSFRVYLEPQRSFSFFLFKYAQNIKLDLHYDLDNSQALDPVEQLKQVINENIALTPTEPGKVQVIGDKDGKYMATQIFHPFNDLRPQLRDEAALRGWSAGEAVRVWIFQDWTFKVCDSRLAVNEACRESGLD